MATSLETVVGNQENLGLQEGGLYTFKIATATSTADTFTQTDIDNNTTVAVFTGANEIGKGSAGNPIAGKLIKVSKTFQSSTTSDSAAINATPEFGEIQIDDQVIWKYNTDSAPSANNMLVSDGAGKCVPSPAIASTGSFAAGYEWPRWKVNAINTVASDDDFPTSVLALKT